MNNLSPVSVTRLWSHVKRMVVSSLFWSSYCEIPEVLRFPCGMEARLALQAELAKATSGIPGSAAQAPALQGRSCALLAPVSPVLHLQGAFGERFRHPVERRWPRTSLMANLHSRVFFLSLACRLPRCFQNEGAMKLASRFRQFWVSNTAKKVLFCAKQH